jgi:hypothetical protein
VEARGCAAVADRTSERAEPGSDGTLRRGHLATLGTSKGGGYGKPTVVSGAPFVKSVRRTSITPTQWAP